LAAAAAAAAGSLAGTEPSREGGQPGQLHVLPPSFARHCAAITAWGSSIRNLANIAVVALRAMNTESIVGTSEHLVSWLSGGEYIEACESSCSQLCCLLVMLWLLSIQQQLGV
jgi:hypothetical protein